MKNFFYRVGENEGIFSISRRFGVPPTVIVKDNALTCEVSAGDVLFIRNINGRVYAVQPSDTMAELSLRFGVSPEYIAEINGTDYVFYGLTLIIPE